MPLNIRPGIGERGQRVFNYPITARWDYGEGLGVAGRAVVDASKLRAVRTRILVQAQVSIGTISGKVEVYDVTDGEVQLLSNAVTTDQPQTYEVEVTVDYWAPRTFEVRAGLDTGSGETYTDSDKLIVWFGSVEITTAL